MNLHERYRLSTIINAAGTFTPLGVSRSSPAVADQTAAALQNFFVIDELLERASEDVSAWAGTEAATVVHCAAAGITLAVAAMLCGQDRQSIAALPTVQGRKRRIIVPAGHDVNYGHELTQAIRLSGAEVVVADKLETPLVGDAAGVVLVSSRLVRSHTDFYKHLETAKASGLPVLVDGAAQDLRVTALVETGADMIVLSAQKYLAAPTAGLVVGQRNWIDAVRAQFQGIGRCMKPSKEAILGVLAAIEERGRTDMNAWSQHQTAKVEAFVKRANDIPGMNASLSTDPTGLPFIRATLSFADTVQAQRICEKLKNGTPKIFAMEHELANGRLIFELVPLSPAEIDAILDLLKPRA